MWTAVGGCGGPLDEGAEIRVRQGVADQHARHRTAVAWSRSSGSRGRRTRRSPRPRVPRARPPRSATGRARLSRVDARQLPGGGPGGVAQRIRRAVRPRPMSAIEADVAVQRREPSQLVDRARRADLRERGAQFRPGVRVDAASAGPVRRLEDAEHDDASAASRAVDRRRDRAGTVMAHRLPNRRVRSGHDRRRPVRPARRQPPELDSTHARSPWTLRSRLRGRDGPERAPPGRGTHRLHRRRLGDQPVHRLPDRRRSMPARSRSSTATNSSTTARGAR